MKPSENILQLHADPAGSSILGIQADVLESIAQRVPVEESLALLLPDDR